MTFQTHRNWIINKAESFSFESQAYLDDNPNGREPNKVNAVEVDKGMVHELVVDLCKAFN